MHVSAHCRLAFVMSIVVLLAGCTAIPGANSTQPASGVTVSEPFARPSPSEGGNGGAFMTITSRGGADRLVGASSAWAQTVELHETINDGGVMKMRPVPAGFEVPASGALELKPGGKHVMLIGLTKPMVGGEEIEITLQFEKSGEVTVKVPVRQ